MNPILSNNTFFHDLENIDWKTQKLTSKGTPSAPKSCFGRLFTICGYKKYTSKDFEAGIEAISQEILKRTAGHTPEKTASLRSIFTKAVDHVNGRVEHVRVIHPEIKRIDLTGLLEQSVIKNTDSDKQTSSSEVVAVAPSKRKRKTEAESLAENSKTFLQAMEKKFPSVTSAD
jgi:hypothetical protein